MTRSEMLKWLIALLMCSGCATNTTFRTSGGDAADRTLDAQRCQSYGYNADKNYLACMEKKGYQIQAVTGDQVRNVKFSELDWQ